MQNSAKWVIFNDIWSFTWLSRDPFVLPFLRLCFRISVRMSSVWCQSNVLRRWTVVTLVLLPCLASVAFVISRFTSYVSSRLPLVRHILRRTNSFIDNNHADVAERLAGLVQRRATASDPQLIQLIRDMMDPPSKHMIKIAGQLINTPQSREVDRILKRKVIMSLHR